jgi:hypothetical protein
VQQPSTDLLRIGQRWRMAGPPRLGVRPALVALFALAAALRLAFLEGPFFGEEAIHYAVARHWGADPANVFPPYSLNQALWWQRPVFSLLLAPGAAAGLVAYRVEHALVASLLPPLAVLVARKAGVRPWLAYGAGVAIAAHPAFVLWGARAFPDTAMAVFVLGGLLAHQAGRPLVAAGLLLAAAWTKETALLALLGLLGWTLWRGRAAGGVRFWPLELDRPSTALLGAALLAPLPLAYSVLGLGGSLLGWADGPARSPWAAVAGALPTAWLLLPLIAGLASPRVRPWVGLALLPLVAAAAGAWIGFGIPPAAAVLPGALALVAAAVALDQTVRHASPRTRLSSRVAAAGLAFALLVVAVVPDGGAARAVAALAAEPAPSLAQVPAVLRSDPLGDAVGAIRPEQWAGAVLLVDVGWHHVHSPFAERARFVGWSYTTVDLPAGDWTHAVEGTDATVLRKVPRPLNEALRATYADCAQFEDGHYVVLAGKDCAGRTQRLVDELAARSA